MIVGIEQTTDTRDRQTKIRQFRTRAAARAWASEAPSEPAFADDSNHHRRIRSAFDLPGGFHRYRTEIQARCKDYRTGLEDSKALTAWVHGEKLSK